MRYLFIIFLFLSFRLTAQSEEKSRLVVLSDIEAEVDDTESFVRLLLYSNQIDIKGMIATSSVWKKKSVAPEAIKKLVEAYRKVQPNLLKHEANFPSADALMGVVKQGLPVYGMLGVGEGKDSEGSDWIIKELEANDPRPLWVNAWGGVNTLAQALYKIQATKTASEAKRLIAKLRVYTISDQDDTGIWIRDNFPDLFYIVSPADDYGSATWSGINTVIEGVSNESISNAWLALHIQQGHGPLGAEYPDVAYGMEGDTPSWLSLIPNGLASPEHPEWGGWGGRYELYKPDFSKAKKGSSGVPFQAETRPIWTNAVDSFSPLQPNIFGRTYQRGPKVFKDNKVSLWRWRDDFQNDFAARMDWCTLEYENANHPPIARLAGSKMLYVKSGEDISLDASASTDPDGDNLSFLWYSYPEAGTYHQPLIRDVQNTHTLYLKAPLVTKEETAHIILEVSDKGIPALRTYRRIIVHIKPK